MNTLPTETFYYGVDGEGIRGPSPLAKIVADLAAGILTGAVGVSRGMYGPWVPLSEMQAGIAPKARLATTTRTIPAKPAVPPQARVEATAGAAERSFTVTGVVDSLGWLCIIFGGVSIGVASFWALGKDPACVPWFGYAASSLATGLSLLVVSVALNRLTRIATAVEKLASKSPTP